MATFRAHALAAVVFAVVATIVSAQFEGFLDALMNVFAIAYLPLVFAISIGGSVHNPSATGIYIGFFFNWLILSLIVATVVWVLTRKRGRVAT
jgi:hypothetical protein